MQRINVAATPILHKVVCMLHTCLRAEFFLFVVGSTVNNAVMPCQLSVLKGHFQCTSERKIACASYGCFCSHKQPKERMAQRSLSHVLADDKPAPGSPVRERRWKYLYAAAGPFTSGNEVHF